MTAVTWIMKKSRLSKLIDDRGGKTVAAALRDAAVQTRPMREEAVAAVADRLARLEAVIATAPAEAASWLDDVYALSSGLLDVAGPFGFDDMCAAAFSLCELCDRQKREGQIRLAPIQVHVASLRLLTREGDPAEIRQAVLDGLRRVTEQALRPTV